MHVWGDTLITMCDEIVRTTRAEGSVTFVLFFMRGAYSWPGQTICMTSLDNELAWPETWQLLDFWALGYNGFGWLDPDGPTHALHIEWNYSPYEISDEPQGIVPVAVLVMDVTGPGKLDVVARYGQNPVELLHGCGGSPFVTYPVQAYAEAGMQCGYISYPCGTWVQGYQCEPHFEVPELLMSAPAGAPADTTVDFWATYQYWTEDLCPLAVDTHASWCTAWIDPEYEFGHAHLHVTANGDGLAPGLYETAIELTADAYWGVARCLPVEFTVEENQSPATPMTWGRIKALFR
jgi:hypothetical protein